MIEPSWVGRRVSVRRTLARAADGRTRHADVVGDLVRLTWQFAIVETRNGPITFGRESVAAARLVEPSTAAELALEAIAASGWRPEETGELGGWVLRAAAGFTSRANSVLPLGAPGRPLEDAIAAAGDWYAERDLPLRIAVPVHARRLLDADLAERHWPAEPDVLVLAARLDMVDAAAASEVGVSARPDDGWLSRYRGGAGLEPGARALLVRHDRAAFASIRRDGVVVAVGRGVVDGADGELWLGVSAVEVDPALRRQGLAGAVMSALCAWGAGHGARRSYLQVSSDNAAALALYERLGYWPHHLYRYRTQPKR